MCLAVQSLNFAPVVGFDTTYPSLPAFALSGGFIHPAFPSRWHGSHTHHISTIVEIPKSVGRCGTPFFCRVSDDAELIDSTGYDIYIQGLVCGFHNRSLGYVFYICQTHTPPHNLIVQL